LKGLVRAGVLSLLGMCTAMAAEIVPFEDGAHLGVHVKNLRFPSALRKDLRSGLTNRLLVHVELRSGVRLIEERTVEVAVKYDLWEENFRLTVTNGVSASESNLLAREEQVLAYLGDIRLPALFELAPLHAGREHSLKGEVLLNPIENERMEMIRKWVAENSTQTPRGTDQGGRAPAAPVGAATSGDLFNRIFDQYTASASGVAWRDKLQSKSFRPEAVAHEGK
jgi:hypothetical protein